MRSALVALAVLAGSAEAQWRPLPTATPRATATPRPTPAPTTPAPTPAPTAPPSATPGACACDRAPLLRLLPAPMLVSTPAVGGVLRWPDGAPVEVLIYHAEGATPAAYSLVRSR